MYAQVSQTWLAGVGRFLKRMSSWLFDLAVQVFCRWMLAGKENFRVPTKTVHSLLMDADFSDVHLLKIDVEGAELQVKCHPGYER